MQCGYTAWLVSDVRDDKRDGVDVGVKVEALEAGQTEGLKIRCMALLRENPISTALWVM